MGVVRKEKGPCLWENKKPGHIITCGYDIEYGAGIFEEGIKRYAELSMLRYSGKIAM